MAAQTTSTVWLGHDRRNQELAVYQHLSGWDHVRQLRDYFTVEGCGDNRKHDLFVMRPLGISLRKLQETQPHQVFESSLVADAMDQTLSP
ncbi:uncharacterized protein PpBr36_10251 [Pyricularia pennisetigena]|uniref:uncharacterized protein n=1 Tax=Pyricularia pennisetigena TaxID=1578925 RepID=UPI0011512826|nr:uncharacterized protein PpBr36_10251 [Pyricularia pennisetigena]TLS21545.1 hypothetical protein PpBr36_10251 [Pyricularia pennisetigena]